MLNKCLLLLLILFPLDCSVLVYKPTWMANSYFLSALYVYHDSSKGQNLFAYHIFSHGRSSGDTGETTSSLKLVQVSSCWSFIKEENKAQRGGLWSKKISRTNKSMRLCWNVCLCVSNYDDGSDPKMLLFFNIVGQRATESVEPKKTVQSFNDIKKKSIKYQR